MTVDVKSFKFQPPVVLDGGAKFRRAQSVEVPLERALDFTKVGIDVPLVADPRRGYNVPKGAAPLEYPTMMREAAIRAGHLAMTRAEAEAFQRMTPEQQATVSRLMLAKQRAELAAESQVALLQHPAARFSRNERKRRRQRR